MTVCQIINLENGNRRTPSTRVSPFVSPAVSQVGYDDHYKTLHPTMTSYRRSTHVHYRFGRDCGNGTARGRSIGQISRKP